MPHDPFRFTTLAHAGREFLGPVDERVCAAMLDAVGPVLAPRPRAPEVLDVGCGKGAWLLRAMLRLAARGVGVDPNPAFVAELRDRAEAAGCAASLTLHTGTYAPALVDGHMFDLVLCVGAVHAFGDFAALLRGAATLTRPDGAAIVGMTYWRREPDPEFLAAIGGQAEEAASLAATLAAPAEHGWRVLAHHASTFEQWDDYEHPYARQVREWCAAHPGDPDAPLFLDRITTWSDARERWGRQTMGFVSLALARA